MDKSTVYLIIVSVFVGLCIGIFQGIHIGLYQAFDLGPKAACEAYRLSLYDCSTFDKR